MKIHEHDAGHMIKTAAKPIYGKNPSKIFFSRIWELISMKLGMLHFGLQPIIVCSNNWPWVDLDLFYGEVNFGNISFYIEKCHSDGFFENLQPYDLEIGWYTTKWVNIGYEVPLSSAKHYIDILGPDIRWAFTGPMVLWLFFSCHGLCFAWWKKQC